MKKVFFLAGLIAILVACSSEKVNFSQLQDRNGLFYLVNKDKPFTGDVASYSNGKVEFEGRIEDGLRVGLWTTYYSNGQKQMEGSYKEGLKDGTWTYWQENGQQQAVEIYKYGKLLSNEGTVTDPATVTDTVKVVVEEKKEAPAAAAPKKQEYKPEAVVWERLHGGPVKYLNGVPYTGPVVKYFKTGGKELDGYFERGKRSGKWVYYDKYGNVKDVRYY